MEENYNLQAKNSLAMPICGKYFLAINSAEKVLEKVNLPVWKNNRKIILGGGTNIFFTQDFPGIVIHPQFFGRKVIEETDKHIKILFGAGESWDTCVEYCVDNNYFGIENLSGIPGTIGAAPVQNIGAYGVEIESSFDHAHTIDVNTGQENIIYNDECQLSYRDSIFKHEFKDKKIISAVCLKLQKQFIPNLSYQTLAKYINLKHEDITAATMRKTIIAIRSSKLPCPSVIPNAGSFFKNPIIDQKHYEKLANKFPNIPHYPYGETQVKVPAGWLIEQSGLKNFRHNRVGTHEHHALVLVNHSNGSAKELNELIEIITNKVKTNFDITLEPEVRLI